MIYRPHMPILLDKAVVALLKHTIDQVQPLGLPVLDQLNKCRRIQSFLVQNRTPGSLIRPDDHRTIITTHIKRTH